MTHHPVLLDEQPYAAFTALTAHPADVVGRCFDLIESDPENAMVRRRFVRPASLWAFTMSSPDVGGGTWSILWELDDHTPRIRYLGPNRIWASW